MTQIRLLEEQGTEATRAVAVVAVVGIKIAAAAYSTPLVVPAAGPVPVAVPGEVVPAVLPAVDASTLVAA